MNMLFPSGQLMIFPADDAQMRVAESARIFEAVAERAIETHMRKPDKRDSQEEMRGGEAVLRKIQLRSQRQNDRPDRHVHRVIRCRARSRAEEIKREAQIGHE